MVLDAEIHHSSLDVASNVPPDLYLLRLCAQNYAAWKDLIETLAAHTPLDELWPRERFVERERLPDACGS